jgi:hypothetical protein
MKKTLHTLVCTVLCVFLFSGAVFASDQGLVIDIDKTTMSGIEIHVPDLSQTIKPFGTDTLFKALRAADEDMANIAALVFGAQIKELAVSYDGGDFLAALGLPAGDLSLLGQGELSVESLSKAFGASSEPYFREEGLEKSQLTAVAPQIFSADSDQFIAVEGQTLLVGTSQKSVQAGLDKVKMGQAVVAVPNSGQATWMKTTYTVFHAATEAGPFKETPLIEEVLVFNTKDGLELQKTANYTDIIPSLNAVTPVNVKDLPFFGSTDQNIIFSVSGSLLDVVSKIKLASEGSSMSADGMLPFALKDVKRITLVTGGAQSSVMGMAAPAFYASIDAAASVLDFLTPLVQSLNGEGWKDKQVSGWDSMSTVDTLVIGGSPLPVPGFMGKRGEQMVLGSMNSDSLAQAAGMPEMLKTLPDNAEYSMMTSLAPKSLWSQVAETMKPGSMLRALSGVDSGMDEAEKLALEKLFATPFPVKQIIQWSSPNLNETRGVVLLDGSIQPFIDAVCNYIIASEGEADSDAAAPAGQAGAQNAGEASPAKPKEGAGTTEENLFDRYKNTAPKK